MEDGRPSRTAAMAAIFRAHECLFYEEPRLLNDNLAMALAEVDSAEEVKTYTDGILQRLATGNEPAKAQAELRRMIMTAVVRSRFFEDRLAAARDRGATQLVILGAGLDSTAYRRADLTDGLQVFEVDHPSTQAWKRDRLGNVGVTLPDNLEFLPFDFERQTLAEAMAAGGVHRDATTLFGWLGVQPYLTPEAVAATLDVVAAFAKGSELVMDLTTLRDEAASVRKGRLGLLAGMGEPFKSAYAVEDFRTILQTRGFSRIEIVGYAEWLRRNAPADTQFVAPENGPSLLVSAQI